ncbi:hypothetical protein [Bradyrhizobium arachidis]|uniref:hypothetical protein n=1 Tax=Bradyrhizobium arachidis TaxID=858423 RepID=UPI002201ECBF|nr:hypothetical protein KUF59_05350 [Bradyrhizobium arachidis]
MTDARNVGDLYRCIDQRYADQPRPALTIANFSQLAHAGMMIEIEATAAIANSDNDNTFSIFRNKETLGKWKVGPPKFSRSPVVIARPMIPTMRTSSLRPSRPRRQWSLRKT